MRKHCSANASVVEPFWEVTLYGGVDNNACIFGDCDKDRGHWLGISCKNLTLCPIFLPLGVS